MDAKSGSEREIDPVSSCDALGCVGIDCMIEGIEMGKASQENERPADPGELEKMRHRMEMLENRVYAAKIAYINRTPFDGKEMSYEELSAIAKEYIRASYALQKAKFGSVKVKMSVPKLLR